MATTVAHASLIRYDSDGNQLVINLKNTGDDVSINRSSNGNLPSGATTAQGLANSLGALAFRSSLGKGDVGLGNVDNTADSAKSVKYATSAGSANAVAWGNVSGKPSTYPPSAHTHTKSQITDFPTSLPASDVYAWAKAKSKPSYSKSEVGLGNVDNTADSSKSVKYATSAGSANAVAWGNVSGRPSTFTPSAHNHCVMNTIGDYRSKNTKPCDYNEQIIFQGLKGSGTINLVGPTYSYLVGLRGWVDISGGQAHEIAFNDYGIYTRKGTSETTWDTWRKFLTTAVGANGIYVGKEAPAEECVWVKID